MRYEVELLDGSNASLASWQEFVERFAQADPRCHAGWYRILENCFSVKMFYLCCLNGQHEVLGVLPLYFSGGFLSSPHLATMGPGVLSESPGAGTALYGYARDLSKHIRANFILVRGDENHGLNVLKRQVTVRPLVFLMEGSELIWHGLSSNTRRKIRKARKNGFTVEESPDDVDAFYRCYAIRMRDLGTPVMGRCMFQAMQQYLREHFRLFVVRERDTVVGGMLVVQSSQMATSFYVSIQSAVLGGYPMYLLYWSVIHQLSKEGFSVFDLGRSAFGDGNHRFKQQFATQDVKVTFSYCGDRSLGEDRAWKKKLKQAMINIWRQMPLPVANFLGPIVRRTVPFG